MGGALIATALTKWNPTIDLQEWVARYSDSMIREIGADIPCCVLSHLGQNSYKIKDAGHIESTIPSKNTYQIILAKPIHGACTSKSFSMEHNIKEEQRFEKGTNPIEFSRSMTNQLPRLSSQTAEMEELMNKSSSCLISRMSGSGSGCFGIFENSREKDKVMKNMQIEFPDSWLISAEIMI